MQIIIDNDANYNNGKNKDKRMMCSTKRCKLWLGAMLMACLCVACSAPKQISYFQDLRPGETIQEVAYPAEIRIQSGDQLSILVKSRDAQLADLFNLPIMTSQMGQSSRYSNGVTGSYSSSRGLSGYTVNKAGEIDFPVLGALSVVGKTREEIASYIKQELISQNLVKDPVVTVEYMNLSISVLGEVARPGRYAIDRDEVTLLDAISMAGDLTIQGRRENVKVLREENGKRLVYGVDLTSAERVYGSPVYNLRQNDVVYVEPNEMRARQSTVNGNNVRSTSFWISLSSLLTSVAVLIFK